ncbi:glycerol-3-phosphate 1-O-acyltransferase PlsY [Candidatus Cyanaurora vandensis]|uniref:glycerol-3-phosphate 1-O-acyltransferase PlsY n=1 Tax=Candidatus Cyanaurora vandensis TaxID=2714958 RepID=UPI00257FF5BA|nr:glycerol-3-phosphate 1-O-acyltransferase PlsY [Candidatus Cyanaurora vandensis]
MDFALGLGCLVAAYLLGAVSPGYLVVRALKGVDIRQVGSGSTGATNVLRVAGKLPALGVLLFDLGKGFIALKLTQIWLEPSGYETWWAVGAGLMAILGHSKSIWLGGQGGKSVAVSLGLLFAVDLRVALATLALWGAAVGLTRMVSVGSVLGGLGVTILMLVFGQPPAFVLLGLLGGAFVVWRHRSNLQRLRLGTEPRLGEKS